MTRLALLATVLCGAIFCFSATSDDQTPELTPEADFGFAPPDTDSTNKPENLPDSTDSADSAREENPELRKQYLKLVEQKSQLMDKSALREAISNVERDIDELKAETELAEARQMLLRLVETYPNTKAAVSARNMLQNAGNVLPSQPSFYNGGGTPTFSAPSELPNAGTTNSFRSS